GRGRRGAARAGARGARTGAPRATARRATARRATARRATARGAAARAAARRSARGVTRRGPRGGAAEWGGGGRRQRAPRRRCLARGRLMRERLLGVIHLAPLPGSPRASADLAEVAAQAARDARTLAEAGYDGMIVENFGDAPFARGSVAPVTVAAMTRCALAAREAAPALALGVNVLRNDAEAALAVAAAADASMVRINVHTGARLTDQGIVTGEAYTTLRARRALGLSDLRLLCDVAV